MLLFLEKIRTRLFNPILPKFPTKTLELDINLLLANLPCSWSCMVNMYSIRQESPSNDLDDLDKSWRERLGFLTSLSIYIISRGFIIVIKILISGTETSLYLSDLNLQVSIPMSWRSWGHMN